MPNLLSMHFMYVSFNTVLATISSTALLHYKTVMQHFLGVNHGILHLNFLGIHTCLMGHVCTKSIQVASGLFHGKQLKNVA